MDAKARTARRPSLPTTWLAGKTRSWCLPRWMRATMANFQNLHKSNIERIFQVRSTFFDRQLGTNTWAYAYSLRPLACHFWLQPLRKHAELGGLSRLSTTSRAGLKKSPQRVKIMKGGTTGVLREHLLQAGTPVQRGVSTQAPRRFTAHSSPCRSLQNLSQSRQIQKNCQKTSQLLKLFKESFQLC